jgi:peroxiredoxin Q/BCP
VTVELNVGDNAPNFSLPRDGGEVVNLSDFSGKKLVVYFYPKDSTPGCTTEAIDFTNAKDDFAAAGTEIVGVSRDSLKRHENFINKQNLGIALLSDEEGKMTEDYGVWVEKKNYGRTYMGIERSTFLIDESGKITHVWRKVRVKGHVDAVLAAAKGE